MQRVLSRDVTADGRVYPEGTPVDELPEANRESAIGTGWTRPARRDQPAPDESPDVHDGDSAPDADSPAPTALPTPTDAAATPEPSPEATEQPPAVEATADAAATETSTDSRTIADLDLTVEVRELLTGAGITTVAEAIVHRTAQGSFRTIKKIGKATNDLINAQIDGE